VPTHLIKRLIHKVSVKPGRRMFYHLLKMRRKSLNNRSLFFYRYFF